MWKQFLFDTLFVLFDLSIIALVAYLFACYLLPILVSKLAFLF